MKFGTRSAGPDSLAATQQLTSLLGCDARQVGEMCRER
jgi:hypothetical protein